MMKDMKLNPYASILIGVFLGSTTGVWVKLLNLPSTSMSFFRMIVPVVFIFIYLLIKRERKYSSGGRKNC